MAILEAIAVIVTSVLAIEVSSAAPVMLICKSTSRGLQGAIQIPYENIYQVTFDESTSTATVDDSTPFKAKIGATMIDWGSDKGVYRWHIDRLTGRFTLIQPGEQDDGFGYHEPVTESGICTAPPSRKF